MAQQILSLTDLIGNENIKIQLAIAGKAALINNAAIPHTLFAGSAGCGKTSTARALSANQDCDILLTPPEGLKTTNDIADVLKKLCVDGYDYEGNKIGKTRPTIIFLDEIHKMPLGGQEALGIAMEEKYIATRNKYTGQTSHIRLPDFTVIGATTILGKLSKPFCDRFRLSFHFEPYSFEDSLLIVKKQAEIRNIKINEEAVKDIALRSRGVPRTMVTFLERAKDSIVITGRDEITEVVTNAVFALANIDDSGLDKNDLKILETLYTIGMPIGIDTLSVILDESTTTVQNSREPYLIQRGLLIRTGRGRMITEKGIKYLMESGRIKNKRNFVGGMQCH